MTESRVLGERSLMAWWEDQPIVDWYELGMLAGFNDPRESFGKYELLDIADLASACRVTGIETIDALEQLIAESTDWALAALISVRQHIVDSGRLPPAAYPPDVLAMIVMLASPYGWDAVLASSFARSIRLALDEVLAERHGLPPQTGATN